MQTHKFVAATMKEALARIKEELGEDAMIIKSERVKAGGRLGARLQEMVEVTAASASEAKADAQGGPDFAETLDHTISHPPVSTMPAPQTEDLSQLKDDVKRLREELTDIGKHFKYSNLPNMPRELLRLWESMGQSGVNQEWATDLAQEALLRLGPEQLVSATAVESYLLSKIIGAVRPAPQMAIKRTRAYKILLVGSPGAGKTTLLQKLASDPVAYGKRKVGLMSMDTHRMAAIKQLKTFARIAAAPFEIIYNPNQVVTALNQLSTSEVILIDTAGCTAVDPERITELRAYVDAINPDEIHLVQNSSVRDEDLIYAARKFRDIGISHLSFTRLDESIRHGYLLNVAKAAERPVGWISAGQKFIGNLERFTPDHLRQWMTMSDAAEADAQAMTEIVVTK